ncbi:LarC family nickel insertion protein [Budvicia diplopodorum]|uniref:LarC family nickel insertion protein n=1 Tax=Budvicia diplopodorum TaxID=1119056 RepID=UPI0013569A8E|nr:LarC family nickel insertion protein [Budvicia diplopodorum]
MHIHLDAVGGIAGDMFCAAMLDTFPELSTPLFNQLNQLALSSSLDIELEPAQDKGLNGKRFQVRLKGKNVKDTTHFVFHSHQQHACVLTPAASQHQHNSWQKIIHTLEHAPLADDVRQCAIEIYTLLAQAESQVHQVELSQIHLHEVGALDALADIISAAFLIIHCGAKSWSFSSLPWGGGTVRCEHGEIPVPAPATLKLLEGFNWHDDGESGERVTPTGAAILVWLKQFQRPIGGHAERAGYGFGNKRLKQRANVLRLCPFTAERPLAPSDKPNNNYLSQTVCVIQCDIDDMTPELLAIAQQKLRALGGLIDLTSQTLQGKKQRWVVRLEAICLPENLSEICDAIFIQTSTLGVRYWETQRFILPRTQEQVEFNQQNWPVKYALRPNGERSCKLEADSLLDHFVSHYQRQTMKGSIEK